jgi:hypothetical protein
MSSPTLWHVSVRGDTPLMSIILTPNITVIHGARGRHRSEHCPLPAALRHARTGLRVRFQSTMYKMR